MNLGAPEIILIMIVLFFFFGANKIPEIMKGLGTGLRQFRKAAKDTKDQVEEEVGQVDSKKEESRQQIQSPNASERAKKEKET